MHVVSFIHRPWARGAGCQPEVWHARWIALHVVSFIHSHLGTWSRLPTCPTSARGYIPLCFGTTIESVASATPRTRAYFAKRCQSRLNRHLGMPRSNRLHCAATHTTIAQGDGLPTSRFRAPLVNMDLRIDCIAPPHTHNPARCGHPLLKRGPSLLPIADFETAACQRDCPFSTSR